VHGVFVGGTSGEIWALDDEQFARLVRFSREACRGRVPLYVGASFHSTSGALARARLAEKLGADVIVSLAPYYTAPSQAGIVRHFQALASATSLPILIYQFPGIVKTSIALPTYEQLAAIPGVVGVKDSQGDVTQFFHMIETLRSGGRDFRLLLGTEALTVVTMQMGGQGTVPAIGNVCAPYLVEAYEAAVVGDWPRAEAAQAKASPVSSIYRAMASDSGFDGFLAGLKGALKLLGVEAGPPAPPLRPCNASELKTIEGILHSGGLL
jgi:4-hydroxy-tetrahydrodipicolinate synthase